MAEVIIDTPRRDDRETLSDILVRMLDRSGERITIGDMVDAFGARAFGALLFVFSIPNLLPLPPGSSTILSIPLVIIAPQLLIGTPNLWLPRSLDRRSLKRADLRQAFARVLPRLRSVERLSAPRLSFVFGPWGDRLIGLVCTLLTLVLILPIPFGNMLPAAAIAALALGLTQRDGVVALIGYAIAGASVVVLALSAAAVMTAARKILEFLGA